MASRPFTLLYRKVICCLTTCNPTGPRRTRKEDLKSLGLVTIQCNCFEACRCDDTLIETCCCKLCLCSHTSVPTYLIGSYLLLAFVFQELDIQLQLVFIPSSRSDAFQLQVHNSFSWDTFCWDLKRYCLLRNKEAVLSDCRTDKE